MKRRQFIKAGGALGITAFLPMLQGCPTVAQVVLDVEGVLTEGEAVLNAAGQTAWANELGDAVTALKAAYTVWDQSTTSTTGQKVEVLLNALVAATAAILPNDPWASLIDQLVALVDLTLSFFPGLATAAAPGVVRPTVAPNPHIGAVLPPVSYKDAKSRWNALAVGPLAGARIK